jgi:hypothetical protein
VRVGEIVLFLCFGRLVAHRVVSHCGTYLIMRGDGIPQPDPLPTRESLLLTTLRLNGLPRQPEKLSAPVVQYPFSNRLNPISVKFIIRDVCGTQQTPHSKGSRSPGSPKPACSHLQSRSPNDCTQGNHDVRSCAVGRQFGSDPGARGAVLLAGSAAAPTAARHRGSSTIAALPRRSESIRSLHHLLPSNEK